MAKVEVILSQHIVGLGAESDQVKVAAGFARNYLLPHGLAFPLTQGNKKRLEALRKRRAEREAHDLNAMTELAKSLSKMTLTIAMKTGDDGKLFGSVTNGTIADELKKQFEVALDKRKIHVEKPIKSIGEHEAEMRLHADVQTTLKIIVNSSNPLPTPAVATAPETEKRGKSRRFDDAKAEAPAPAAEAKPERKGKAAKA
ncbi:MAG: hypothetical protein RL514_1545 [Verrucomicrobiota bacterium]|jgi:large subunit ribosomal protein L9